MDKIEKIPIPEDVKRVLDSVSHILIGLNYKETARDYKQAVEKLISLSEEPVQKFNTDKLQEIAKPATPHKKHTPEDRAKFMEELHEYAESKKPDKSLEVELEKESPKELDEMIDDYFKSLFPNIAYYKWRTSDVYVHASPDGIRFLCDHFYELGQSQMPMPEDTVLFNKGVAEGRRLEREDSVECEVTDVGFNYLDLALFDAESLELKAGDKIKVIVLKDNEDESK